MWPGEMTSVAALEAWAARPYDGSEANRLGLYTRADRALIGAAGLRCRTLDPKSTWHYVDVNYWLGPQALGCGYATEAARRLARHAFDDLESPRVEIRTEPQNLRSRLVAERLGFRLEGTLRSVGFRRGAPVDLALYALVASERDVLDRVPRLGRDSRNDA